MLRKAALVAGETYHIYNRGAHKQPVFVDEGDYVRFLLLLYVANHSERVRLSDLLKEYPGPSWIQILSDVEADKSLVDVLAYSLIPNHFHLVLRQKAENGCTVFMKKVATAYAMYFNLKYEHSGVLFQGCFKSSHIENEPYFRYIFSYVHLNLLDLIEPGWKENGIKNVEAVRKFINTYPYSSFQDYATSERPQRKILSWDEAPLFLKEVNDFEDLIQWQNKNNQDRPGVGKLSTYTEGGSL